MADNIELVEKRVLFAIERIERAETQWKLLNQDAKVSTQQITNARAKYEANEQEFAWQWRNVKRLLTHYRALEQSAREVVEQMQRVSSKEADLAQAQRDEMNRINERG